MYLAHCLAFVKAKFEFELLATHLSGVCNAVADAFFCHHMDAFHSLLFQAADVPTAISEALLDLLIVSRPDWTSKCWTEYYFLNGLAASTRRAYGSAKSHYAKFCYSNSLSPLSASERQLCQFVSCLANQNLCYSTVKCHSSAVRHLHVAEGHGDPNISSMARLEQVMRGINYKGVQAKATLKQATIPITPELLLKIKQIWKSAGGGGGNKWDNIMLWAACLMRFFGFLRSRDITVPSDSAFDDRAHLSFLDVTVDSKKNPRVIRVHIKASKTDPFRVGVDIFIGRIDNELCPIVAIPGYMAMHGPGHGPFFHFQDSMPLTRPRLVAKLREAIQAEGLDCVAYSGHRFKSGAATTVARKGIGYSTIKMLGLWRSSAY